jgi:nucleotide-binding universal stress UspA family protein
VRRRWPRLLAQFATGALLPGRSVLQLVWPHRAGEPEDERRNLIVVGVDGSRDSLDALEAAGSLAASSGAEVAVVGAHRFLAGHEAELEAEVSQAAARLRERRIEVSAMTRRGDPAFVLSDIAQEQKARLIVVGAGGRGPMARRLLGGVADLVAERAPCNVLIVRRAERPPGRD